MAPKRKSDEVTSVLKNQKEDGDTQQEKHIITDNTNTNTLVIVTIEHCKS